MQASFAQAVIEKPHQIIEMDDRCRLSARIWMPENALTHPVPAIVEHLPYRKRDGTIARDELTHPWFAAHGYVCIRVDMRGNGDSEGLMHDEYTEQELSDACKVIEWASEQPFCSGRVGMMGISWGGFNSLQVAALRPPALKAIITVCSTVDRFADDIHYKGGCLLGENPGWAANVLSYSSRPPDPMLVGDRWRELWLERLENMAFLATPWLGHQSRDDYWKHGSVCENYKAIDAAVLSIGGWHDGYRNTISHLVENITAPVKGIVGPWIHKYPHYAAPKPAIGFLQEAKRWWDRWLKDEDTGVEDDAAYRVWLMDSIAPARWLPARPGRWISEAVWPSLRVQMEHWQLGDDGTGTGNSNSNSNSNSNNSVVGGGTHNALVHNGHSCVFDLKVDSLQSCGQCAGEYFPFAFGPELPENQQADDALSVVFDSSPLSGARDILGAADIHLSVIPASTAANVCVRLCDLRSDGTSALITMGMLNLRHHAGSENPVELTPGIALDISLQLDQIAYRLPAGHRLRIAISSAYWPFIWPSLGRGGFHLTSGSLALPCRQGPLAEADEVSFEPPQTAPAWQVEQLRESASTRDVVTDVLTGKISTLISNDFGENKDLHHGLISGSETHERWSIDPLDPVSAEVVISWEQNGGRDDWQWSTSVVMTMICDADTFYVSGYLVAREGDEVMYEAEYADNIKRVFV